MVLHPFRYGMSAGNINRILRGLASRLTTQFQRDEVSHRPRNLNSYPHTKRNHKKRNIAET